MEVEAEAFLEYIGIEVKGAKMGKQLLSHEVSATDAGLVLC